MTSPTSSDARTWQYWTTSASAKPMPISLRSTRSSASSTTSSASSSLSSSPTSTRVSQHHACAYPSWPSGNIFHSNPSTSSSSYSTSSTSCSSARKASFPSSYVSDEDLFGFDDAPHLREAPAPPRTAEAWSRSATAMPFAAQPVLPPVTAAAAAAVVLEQRRRSSAVSNASSNASASKKVAASTAASKRRSRPSASAATSAKSRG